MKDISFAKARDNKRICESLDWGLGNHKFAPYDLVEIIGTQTISILLSKCRYDPSTGFDYLVRVREDAVYPYKGQTRWVNEDKLRLLEPHKETVYQRIKRRLRSLCK